MKINSYVYHNPFFKKSFFVQLIRRKLLCMYNGNVGEFYQLKEPIFMTMDRNNRYYLASIQEALESELQRLINMSKDFSFKPLFIIIPDRHQVNSQLLNKKMAYYGIRSEDIDVELPNKIIRAKLNSKQILYIDVTDYLRNNQNDHLWHTQDNHLTPLGHKRVAECVYPWLEKIISNEYIP